MHLQVNSKWSWCMNCWNTIYGQNLINFYVYVNFFKRMYCIHFNFLSLGNTKKIRYLDIFMFLLHFWNILLHILSCAWIAQSSKLSMYKMGHRIHVHLWHAAMHILSVLWSVGEKSWHDCNTDLLSIFWHEKYALTLRQLIRLEVLPSYNFTLFSPRPLRDLCCSTFPSYFFFQFIFDFIHFYVSLDFHSSDKVVWI